MAEMLGRRVHLADGSGTAVIEDVAIERNRLGEWDVGQLFLRRPRTSASPFAKGPTTFAAWKDVRERPGARRGAVRRAARRDLRRPASPADLANTLLDLPDERMIEVAEELSDERLADALEEMPEDEQVHILEQLGDERAADILDAMEPDDAADLLGQLTEERSEELLDLMEPEEAEDVRALLKYGPDTAGGLMTSEPIVLSADATVAEALALIRRHELHPALAAAVFVTLPPVRDADRPPARHRALPADAALPARTSGSARSSTTRSTRCPRRRRRPRSRACSRATTSSRCPSSIQARRLVGAVSVDDVLDYLLPDDWRSHDDDDERRPSRAVPTIDREHPEEALMARQSRQASLDAPRGRSRHAAAQRRSRRATGSAGSPRRSPAGWAPRAS